MLVTLRSKAQLKSELFYNTIKVVIGIALIVISAQIRIPLKPVPITLQTMSVILLGLTCTPINAVLSTSLYVILGILGLPVFAGFLSNSTTILGPTGGYLAGFIVASYVVSSLVKKYDNTSWWRVFTFAIIGSLIIFSFGIIWLTYLIGFKQAVLVGFIPFIIPGIIKAVLLAALLKIKSICQPLQ